MKFRTARPGDEVGMNRLYDEAKESMRALGIDQWQKGVPGVETARSDIAAGVARVAEKDGQIVATYTFVTGGEADYRTIDGAWLTEGEDYAAMHRVAVAKDCRGSGLSTELVRRVIREARGRGFASVRVDTHPGNLPMQKMLGKNGFTFCGKIHLVGGPDDGAERLAYERILAEPKLYDITQELFSSVVYPGDLAPTPEKIASIADGAHANVTNLHMCAHNGTHMDAPLHFVDGAASITEMELSQFIGECTVVDCAGIFDAEAARRLIPVGCKRLLIRGGGIPDLSGAEEIVRAGLILVGVEPQSVGGMEAPAPVHRCLLSAGIAALEGIRLGDVAPGRYTLYAAPIKGAGLDGAPVRAVLAEIL